MDPENDQPPITNRRTIVISTISAIAVVVLVLILVVVALALLKSFTGGNRAANENAFLASISTPAKSFPSV